VRRGCRWCCGLDDLIPNRNVEVFWAWVDGWIGGVLGDTVEP